MFSSLDSIFEAEPRFNYSSSMFGLLVKSALFLCPRGFLRISWLWVNKLLSDAPLLLTPLKPIREAPLPLMFISEAPLLFVLFEVEAFEKDGYLFSPFIYYYSYKFSRTRGPPTFSMPPLYNFIFDWMISLRAVSAFLALSSFSVRGGLTSCWLIRKNYW